MATIAIRTLNRIAIPTASMLATGGTAGGITTIVLGVLAILATSGAMTAIGGGALTGIAVSIGLTGGGSLALIVGLGAAGFLAIRINKARPLLERELVQSAYQQAYTLLSDAHLDKNQLETLQEQLDLLSASLKHYSRDDRKEHHQLITNILKLKIAVQGKYPKEIHPGVVKSAKKLQKAALQFFFSKELAIQKNRLDQLKGIRESYTDSTVGDESNSFIDSELKRWKSKHKKGKLVALPKYYHCTDNETVLKKILNSHIRVANLGMYRGAFVSTQIEYETYGPVVICLSDEIERKSNAKPQITKSSGEVKFTDKGEDNHKRVSEREGVRYWVGLQEAIEVQHPSKKVDPIGYFSQRHVCYIGYTTKLINACEIRKPGRKSASIPGWVEEDQIKNICTQAKTLGVQAVPTTHLIAMNQFLSMKGTFTMPKNWEPTTSWNPTTSWFQQLFSKIT